MTALPHWLQVAMLILGLLLIVVGAVLGLSESRSKGGSISVKMRDGNRIGRIGNDEERGK